MTQSKGSTTLGAVLPENRELASEMLRFFKKRTMDKSKKEDVAVNFHHAVFSLLDFLTIEDGIDWLS
jgi:hypothetical protein